MVAPVDADQFLIGAMISEKHRLNFHSRLSITIAFIQGLNCHGQIKLPHVAERSLGLMGVISDIHRRFHSPGAGVQSENIFHAVHQFLNCR